MGAMRQHKFSLSLMMFLQYAVWGVWLPYLANYLMGKTDQGGLGFTGAQVGWILGLAASIGAVSAPFLAGQIADRFINAEKYLAHHRLRSRLSHLHGSLDSLFHPLHAHPGVDQLHRLCASEQS
jgi:MFS family permease